MAESSVAKGFGMGAGCCLFVLVAIALAVLIPIFGLVWLMSSTPDGKPQAEYQGQNTSSDGSVPDASDIYNAPTQDQAIQLAKKFVVGTWTCTDVGSPWTKMVVKDDGTVLMYGAFPSANGWGDPITQQWDISTEKYSDTGTRYYGLRFKDSPSDDPPIGAIIKEDGTLSLSDCTLHRGDAFPFSK